jgi:hypothetical protein
MEVFFHSLVTLDNAPAGAPVLDNAPGPMVLAILAANLGA